MDHSEQRYAVVNRAVFPTEDVAEVSALYVDTGTGDGSQPGEFYEIVGRRSIRIYAHRRVSLAAFFNAFPASYWQRYTSVREVRLTASFSGTGLISVYRSSARGRSSAVASRSFDNETVTFDLPVTSFVDGGMYWFEVACGNDDAVLLEADWSVEEGVRRRTGAATVGITTFNRPSYCLKQLEILGGDQSLVDVVNAVVVVDQGTDLVSDQPGFAAAAEALGSRLDLVRQPNLGGSGGFSRAMLEGIGRDSEYVLLLDDDAISEPEAIARSVLFSDFAVVPTIVGGGMLHLDDRSVLYTRGEVWDPRRVWMAPSGGSEYNHDFVEEPLRTTSDLHRRLHTDFNGWWMCLIPTEILRSIGLSLPVFIKFDDIEYSIRAQAHGYPTICLPGVAVWHMAWHDKDPTRTWEEYFFHRNRWITGLLHGTTPGNALPLISFLGDVKQLFLLQYSSARLRQEALRDILRGPDAIAKMLPTRQAEIRAIRGGYIDATVEGELSTLPPIRPSSSRITGKVRRPTNPFATLSLALRVAFRQLFVPASAASRRNPQRIIAAQDISWWRFADIDSALVTSPDGMGVAWYQRDRRKMVTALLTSARLHARLVLRWKSLREKYTGRAPEIVSPEAWTSYIEDARHRQAASS